jgi:hypothetical protein
VDKRGAPLAVVTRANQHDKTAAIDVLVTVAVERPSKPKHLCADAAYDSADVRDFMVLEGYNPSHQTEQAARRRGKEPEPQGLGETTYPARRSRGRTYAIVADQTQKCSHPLVKESSKLAGLRSLRLCPHPPQPGGFWRESKYNDLHSR